MNIAADFICTISSSPSSSCIYLSINLSIYVSFISFFSFLFSFRLTLDLIFSLFFTLHLYLSPSFSPTFSLTFITEIQFCIFFSRHVTSCGESSGEGQLFTYYGISNNYDNVQDCMEVAVKNEVFSYGTCYCSDDSGK